MKPATINNSQGELFRNRLSNQLNPKHELLILSKLIPWDKLEAEFSELYVDSGKGGQPPKPVRLMIGIMLLQNMHNLSDEVVVKSWVENPYWQHFCGYDFIEWEMPIDPSSLTRWRQRLGKERLESILQMTVGVAKDSGFVKTQDLETVIVDTTVMPKNIEFPTDNKLLEKSRQRLVKLAQKHGIELRQNYNQVSKKLLRKISGYLHAKQMKRARGAMKKFKTIVGRVARDIERKTIENSGLQQIFARELEMVNHLLNRKKTDKNKLYSLHEPEVVCISKGKAHKSYEFGCKVSLGITHKKGGGIITSCLALPGNPYDGHTLAETLELSQKITGRAVKTAFVDKGYKGHKVEDINVYISGQRKNVTLAIKQKMKRRQAIEPHIGHMKQSFKLGLNRLKGVVGNCANALLTAAAYNLKQILRHLRNIFVQILWMLLDRNMKNLPRTC